MARVTGIRLPTQSRRAKRLMRSDNLCAAPHWITPEIVGRILAIAMPVDRKTVPITTVPTRGVKPALMIVEEPANVPATHSRHAEESEAAIVAPHAASPRRCWEVSVERRKAKADAELEAHRPLFQIAFDRGIGIADLARALGRNSATVVLHTRLAGFAFGRRRRLADPLTIEQLLALADPQIPMPELLCDRAKRERSLQEAKARRDKRAPGIARRRAERARAVAERQEARDQVRLERARAAAERQEARDRARLERLAARAASKRKPLREAKQRPALPAVRSAASREPAPTSPAARAQPKTDRAQIDRANIRRANEARRALHEKASAMLDAGQSATRGKGVHIIIAMRAVEAQRAEQTRLGCPIETAKRILQRRYAPVCSMAVYGGDPDLFVVGHRKGVSREELLAMAERCPA